MIAYQDKSAAVSGTSAAGMTITWPGSPAGQLLLMVLGVEGASPGDGPWIVLDDGNVFGGLSSASGWRRVLSRAPSATGSGLEVWAVIWTSGPSTVAWFGGAHLTFVAQGLVYTGEYDPGVPLTDDPSTVHSAASAAVSGDNPTAPSVYAFADELVIALAADQLQSPGYAAPAGWTDRFDSARGATFGNVEITAADKPITVEGDTGSIPWSATASPSGAKGATATLAIRAADAIVAATSPLITIEYPAVPN